MDWKSMIFLIVGVASVYGSPTGTGGDMMTVDVNNQRNFKGYTECRNHEDCPAENCCTLGMQRYSIPTCFPIGVRDDPCIPTKPSPRNFTLSYPNTRTAVEVKSAYLLYCPCGSKFVCDWDTNSCQDSSSLKKSAFIPDPKTENNNSIA